MQIPPLKALIITRNRLLASLYRGLLQPKFKVRVVGLIDLSKMVLKSSINVKLVVLDFDLQDKQGTNIKIIKRVAESGDVHLLILTSHPRQTSMINEILSKTDVGDRIQLANGFGKYVQGSRFLLRAKRQLLALSRE